MRTKHMIPVSSVEDYDIISKLPDNVRSLILSFLPTKEAVATSILSRRWRYAWVASPSMDLDFSSFPLMRGRKLAFANFVNSIIHHFKGEKLRKFRLSLDGYGGNEPRLDDWIHFAVKNKVEELSLCLPKGRTVKIPDCLFAACSSVVALTLKMNNYAFALPSPAGFKMLEKLHLSSISLLDGCFFRELSDNCLQLEELYVGECRINILEIGSDKLKRLTISNCVWVHPIQMKVCAPSLRCFDYLGRAADDHVFERMESLEEVELDLHLPSKLCVTGEQCQSCMLNLLQMVGNVPSLTLSPWCIENLCGTSNLHESVRENVRCLILSLARNEDSVQALAPLLMSCSYLEYLSVIVKPSHIFRRVHKCGGGRRWQEAQGKTLLKHLKNVRLELIDENKSGVKLVKYLLGHARVLEKMTIIPSNDGLEFERLRHKITKSGRISRKVIIEYRKKIDRMKRAT